MTQSLNLYNSLPPAVDLSGYSSSIPTATMELLPGRNRTFKQDSRGALIMLNQIVNTDANRTERNTTMLQITRETVGELTIWHLSGHILRGQECTSLLAAITSQSSRRVLVELSQVESIDAAGLGTLVFLLHWSHEQN